MVESTGPKSKAKKTKISPPIVDVLLGLGKVGCFRVTVRFGVRVS